MKLTSKSIVNLADSNKDQHLDVNEFTKFTKIINFSISS